MSTVYKKPAQQILLQCSAQLKMAEVKNKNVFALFLPVTWYYI